MADKKKSRQKRNPDDEETPTKEDYAVAKYLRFTLEPKKAKLAGMEVNYFIASKAVECLLESKYMASKSKTDGESLFSNKSSCILFCHRMLERGIFHIANKRERNKALTDRVKKKKKKDDAEGESLEKEEDKSAPDTTPKVRERKKAKKEKTEVSAEIETKEDKSKDDDKEKKKKKMVKLEMADVQAFTGGEQYCVWIYDPVPVKTFIVGLLLVIGAIGLCLFPLWPPEVRVGIYYISLVGLACAGFIIFLIILRFIIFCLVWLVTIGKHHFWILPNLTEDVGFIDSFKPAYRHTVCTKQDTSSSPNDSSDKSAKKDKSDKDSKTESSTADDVAGNNGEQDFEVVQYSEVTDEDDLVDNTTEVNEEEGDDVDVDAVNEDEELEDDDDDENAAISGDN